MHSNESLKFHKTKFKLKIKKKKILKINHLKKNYLYRHPKNFRWGEVSSRTCPTLAGGAPPQTRGLGWGSVIRWGPGLGEGHSPGAGVS